MDAEMPDLVASQELLKSHTAQGTEGQFFFIPD